MGTPGEVFTNLESYLEAAPSRINIKAIEPVSVYVINKEESDQLALRSLAYNTLLRKVVENSSKAMMLQNVTSVLKLKRTGLPNTH